MMMDNGTLCGSIYVCKQSNSSIRPVDLRNSCMDGLGNSERASKRVSFTGGSGKQYIPLVWSFRYFLAPVESQIKRGAYITSTVRPEYRFRGFCQKEIDHISGLTLEAGCELLAADTDWD